ncbi:MAG: hypothetical protein ACJAVK_003191 [Akkermansiaceae bacterium]|jgi:hypothetical protein
MQIITYQPFLRPALPEIEGCKEYREERQLFIRIDEILSTSGLEGDFIALCVEHQQFDFKTATATRIETFSRHCVLALRSNIARHIKSMDHRDFCVRLADSYVLQWFLQIGRVEGVKAFAKSSSDRFAHIIDEAGLRAVNARLIALLAATGTPSNSSKDSPGPIDLGLKKDVDFDDIYFDSTCLKAPIHYPVDWVLLRDATRTLMKATVLIRRPGLRHRMPQEPLTFLSDINTLCMKMTAKFRTLTKYVSKAGKLKKLILQEGGAHGSSSTSFYFMNGKLFFIYAASNHWQITGENESTDTSRQNRYYFHNEKCIRALGKTAKTKEASKLKELMKKATNAPIAHRDTAPVLLKQAKALNKVTSRQGLDAYYSQQ